jgi:hypothetical protein
MVLVWFLKGESMKTVDKIGFAISMIIAIVGSIFLIATG